MNCLSSTPSCKGVFVDLNRLMILQHATMDKKLLSCPNHNTQQLRDLVIGRVNCILGFYSIAEELKDNSSHFRAQLAIIETDDKSFVNCTPMASSVSQQYKLKN